MTTRATITGAAKIGFTGTKIHPAWLETYEDRNGQERQRVQVLCSCPGTQNGLARATWLGESVAPNCGIRRK